MGNSDLSHKACLAFTDILYTPELYQKVAFLMMCVFFLTSAPFGTGVKPMNLLSISDKANISKCVSR